jgi:hypothetical protein
VLVWLPLILSGVFFTLAGYRRRLAGRPPEG